MDVRIHRGAAEIGIVQSGDRLIRWAAGKTLLLDLGNGPGGATHLNHLTGFWDGWERDRSC